MIRVVRLVSYEFDDATALQEQLGRSQEEGVRRWSGGARAIRVVTLPNDLAEPLIAEAERRFATAFHTEIGDRDVSTYRRPA